MINLIPINPFLSFFLEALPNMGMKIRNVKTWYEKYMLTLISFVV